MARTMAVILFSMALAIALSLNQEFLFVFCSYFILTLAYSFGLKAFALIDVLFLGCLYTLRVIAGVVVAGAHLNKFANAVCTTE